MHCLSSSVTVLKPLAFILHFFFSSHFNLVMPFFYCPLNQSSILLKSSLKTAISFSILCFQNGSVLFMMRYALTPTFSQTNNAPAHATYLRSNNFLIGIHFSISFTLFTCLVTKFMSLLLRVGLFTTYYFNQTLVIKIFNMIFWCAPRIIL